jgi:predicted phosphodiesterase
MDKINKCIIVNPGEISAHKTGVASFAIYDTKNNEAQVIELKGTVSTKTKESTEYLRNMKFISSKVKTHKY